MSLEHFKERLIGKELRLSTMRFAGTLVDDVQGNTLYGHFGPMQVQVSLNPPAPINPDHVALWEMQFLDDPAAAGPYADWCEEQGWEDHAQLLRRLAQPPEEAPHGHPR